MNRRNLTFTAETYSEALFGTVLENWSPPRLPDQINGWDKESVLGEKMADELRLLHASDEGDCVAAITWALLSKNWRVGGGAEHGFATAVARLAAIGLASLATGGDQ